MSYNCPECNNIMEEEFCGKGVPPNYICDKCNIIYVEQHKDSERFSQFCVNKIILCQGTFEHCCRIYKLKCFT